jgi:hypothetical protein
MTRTTEIAPPASVEIELRGRSPANAGEVSAALTLRAAGLVSSWDFEGNAGLWLNMRRIWRRINRVRPAPAQLELKAVTPRDTWVAYFVFVPNGQLTPHHLFTLRRLRDMGYAIMVVCATDSPARIPCELSHLADALYWKDLPGYDFSAYAIALHAISQASPGATVCVLNDSVYGPLHDLRPFIERPRWDLSGFTASSLVENHLQSYAFVLRDLTPARMASLSKVFPIDRCFNRGEDVILCQELHFASVAALHMHVGASWYGVKGEVADPTLHRPFELLAAGFPFVKKSLLGKHSKFQKVDEVRAVLREVAYPVVD